MRIPCPFCGEREAEEFSVMGEAAGPRPDPAAEDAPDRFHAYVHLRSNPAGETDERWYHAAGCRRWLVVTRDTRTHKIVSARFGP
ncbi:MAG: sarcosine oxidase subunit delta [Caulobacteraceae bacterium]